MERRSLPAAGVAAETRADGGTTLTGYAAVYHDPADPGTQYRLGTDRGRPVVERIAPGAFDRALKEDSVAALYNHNPDHLLGRSTAGTLRLSTDPRGLRYEIDLPNSPLGQTVAEAVRRGDLAGSSFGFRAEAQQWVELPELVVRELRGVRLIDVSPVTFPAYGGTSVGLRADGDAGEALAALAEFRAGRDAEQARGADRRRRRVAADLAALGLPTR